MDKPKNKAKELLSTFGYWEFTAPNTYTATMEDYNQYWGDLKKSESTNSIAIDNALKCVIEILKTNPMKVTYIGDSIDPLIYERIVHSDRDFWENVKLEIETIKMNRNEIR